MPARVYAVANQKGGVGKTTTAVNLAARLAEAGERCLLIDLDPQANATSGLGRRANGVSTHDLLDGIRSRSSRSQRRSRTSISFRRSPSSPRPPYSSRRSRAASGTSADALIPPATDPYTFVFLDCPPAFGSLTVNALAAADRVIVPVQAEYYALEGLSQLLGSINLVKARLNPRARRRRDPADDGGRAHPARGGGGAGAAPPLRRAVFTTSVPRSVRLAEAPSHGLPAIAYDRRSSGSEAYWKVAMELVERQ